MRIAVTGAGGFVGINLVERLSALGHAVTAIDRQFSKRVAGLFNTFGDVVCETIDVLDAVALKKAFIKHRPEALFHGATLTADLNRERTAFADVLAVNVSGTGHVLEASRAAGVGRTIVASSSAVYGDAIFRQSPKETDAVEPLTLYGISKLAAERAALRFGTIHGVEVRAVRIAAVFGPWEHRSGARDVMSPLHQIAEKAVAGETIVLPQGGARDWIASWRAAAAIVELLTRERLEHRLYNISAVSPWLPHVLCNALKVETSSSGAANVDYRDDLSRRRFALDTGRIRAELGVACLGDPTEDAAAFADWIASHRDWFK